MLQFYAKGIQAAIPADTVAETILGAVTDPEPRLRYTCAWGGAELPAGRARMSDEDWVALGRAEDDEAYYKEFRRYFGLELSG
jgi:hypothetical protein